MSLEPLEIVISQQNIVDQVAALLYALGVVPKTREIVKIYGLFDPYGVYTDLKTGNRCQMITVHTKPIKEVHTVEY